jgi:hypothetical protein
MDNKSETPATEPRFLRRADAAKYLKDKYGMGSANTLAKTASVGGGPAFRKLGRFPVYSVEDLDAWARSKMSALVRSTSEFAQRAT